MNDKESAGKTVQELRYQQKKHENDIVHTGEVSVSAMARDSTDLIESLQDQLAASQRRERAAVKDIEKMMRICEKGACHFCANGDCTESPYCSPKWRGPQEAGKGKHGND